MLNFPTGSFTLVTVICDIQNSPRYNMRQIFYSISTRESQFFLYHVLSPGLLFLLTLSNGYLLLPLLAVTSTFFFPLCLDGMYLLQDFPTSFSMIISLIAVIGSQMGCPTPPPRGVCSLPKHTQTSHPFRKLPHYFIPSLPNCPLYIYIFNGRSNFFIFLAFSYLFLSIFLFFWHILILQITSP